MKLPVVVVISFFAACHPQADPHVVTCKGAAGSFSGDVIERPKMDGDVIELVTMQGVVDLRPGDAMCVSIPAGAVAQPLAKPPATPVPADAGTKPTDAGPTK